MTDPLTCKHENIKLSVSADAKIYSPYCGDCDRALTPEAISALNLVALRKLESHLFYVSRSIDLLAHISRNRL